MRSVATTLAIFLSAVLLCSGGANAGTVILAPPLDAAVARVFLAPTGVYGPGHRGIDYGVSTGTPIRAAGAGTVTFAGVVAGARAVTIQHGGGVRTTYSVLSRILVRRGDSVQQGQWIGESGWTHPGVAPGLHFGVKVGDVYVDPLSMLAPSDVSEALHLAPLAWRPVPAVQRLLGVTATAGDYRRPCSRPAAIRASLPAPDHNIAVAVAGIGSSTTAGVAADLYEYGPERLGYGPDKVFWFSYRGIGGPHLHELYRRSDTYGDLWTAVRRLRHLMLALGKRYPGVDVDLFAHSQGGVVARLFLESQAAAWNPRFPRIAHLVTFASPNGGAPLAGMMKELRGSSFGKPLVRSLSHWSRSGGPFPDPLSRAVRQLAPGSRLMRSVARQDVAYGTQVLTLASPFDVVVPGGRAALQGKLNRVVPPNGLDAHSAIVRSEPARRIEYSFLRGGPIACRGWWDEHGSLGKAIDWTETHLGLALRGLGASVSGPLGWAQTLAGRLNGRAPSVGGMGGSRRGL